MTEKQLRQERMQRIARDVCATIADVERQILTEYGEISPKHAALLDNLRTVETTRLEAAEDVAERGMRERYSNGRQTLERKNPAVDTMLRASATAAKVISAMGLSKRGGVRAVNRDSGAVEEADELAGEETDDLDDY